MVKTEYYYTPLSIIRTSNNKDVTKESQLRPRPRPETLELALPSGGLSEPWFPAPGGPPTDAPTGGVSPPPKKGGGVPKQD